MTTSHWTVKIAASLAAALLTAALPGCRQSGENKDSYTVDVPLSESDNGMTLYLTDYDTGETIDSTVVAGSSACFEGTVDHPRLVRLVLQGSRLGQLILEPGNIEFSRATRRAIGSPLNERLNAFDDEESRLTDLLRSLDSAADSAYTVKASALREKYDSLYDAVFSANLDNPIGYMLFVDRAYDWTIDTLDARLALYPQFASSKRLANLRNSLELRRATMPGHQYKDFQIEYDGKTQRLSDYVGRDGRYLLVDFWASWCGPCIRETETLKQLYSKFGPEGTGSLDIVGVAVWDEPDNTLEAISEHSLPWPSILNTRSEATDIYGISSIPCILMIAPDGTIVSRDRQGDELVSEVTSILEASR